MQIIKRYIVFILTLVLAWSYAEAKEDIRFFAKYECNSQEIIVGDSTIVNVVLYSSHPFYQVESKTKNIKIKGGHSREVQMHGDRQQQRVRLDDGIFYALVWQRFVVGNDELEDIRFPELRFSGTFVVYEDEYEYEPVDPFGFFQRPTRKSHYTSADGKAPAFKLPVVRRPKRSTKEVISSGGQVA